MECEAGLVVLAWGLSWSTYLDSGLRSLKFRLRVWTLFLGLGVLRVRSLSLESALWSPNLEFGGWIWSPDLKSAVGVPTWSLESGLGSLEFRLRVWTSCLGLKS